MRARRPVAATTLAALLLASAPANAHPDISMECRILFNMEGGKLTGFGEAWTFDEAFSAQLVFDYDENHDGRFDAAEAKAMETEVLGRLADLHYYTVLTVGGSERETLQPFGFRASLDNGAVTFAFGFRLPEPIDPIATAVSVEVKDPDFAVYAALTQDQPALVRGDRDGRCSASVRDDTEHPYFDGTIVPQEIRLTCRPAPYR